MKSQKGTKGSVGAPRKPIVGLTTKPISGRFTIARLVELNSPGICELTIRKTVEAHVEGKYRNQNGKVTGKATPRLKMLKETMKQDGVGRPNFVYTILGRKAVKVTRKTKTVTVASPETVSAPVVTIPETPVIVPEPTPVVAVEVPAPVETPVTEGSEIPAFAQAAA
jgi:hypothetical protein